MKLESVHIKRFRSIEDDVLDECGNFNVLIGKNNSGKSNVLSAISAFFTCAGNANIVSLNPPNGREIDFFDKNTETPIEVSVTLALSETERAKLLSDIIDEAPQMKNAVDGFPSPLSLSATVTISPPLRAFSIVNKLALVEVVGGVEHLLFGVNRASAMELRDKAAAYQRVTQDTEELANLLSRLGENIWEVLRSRARPSDWRLYVPARNTDLSSETSTALENIIRDSPSFSEFQKGLQTLISSATEEGKLILNEKLKNKIQTFAGEESSIPTYVLNLLTAISEVKVLYLKEYRKPIGKDEAQQLLSLKVQRGGTEVLRNIQSTVENLLGVQIDAFQSSSRGRRVEPEAELDVDNFLVEVNGSGVREALRLILDVQFEDPNILMVEEPETHLHPALEISMMHFLKRVSSTLQVFVTTHSTNFLDTAEMKNVYLVSKDTSTRIQLLNYQEAESQIPKELGLRLSSLFMFDRLVFVEGPSDEGVFREWAATLRVNFSQSNVGFVSMGGVRNFTHYAAEATIAFLTRRQVGIWFILDRDEKDDAEIKALQELFEGRASIYVLTKREIENFMLSPKALAFISFKRASTGKKDAIVLPTEAEIKEALQATADELKQLTIEKRVAKALCKPIFPSAKALFDNEGEEFAARVTKELDKMTSEVQRAKDRLEKEISDQEKSVNAMWESSKLSLVPGDELLDRVCQKYGVRLKKERDSARLASLMTVDEIDESIKKLIREIGGIIGPVH